MALEIKVADQIQVIDIVPGDPNSGVQVITIIVEAVKKWLATDMKEPLTMTISPQTSTGPPSLKIHVNDRIQVNTILR